MTNTTRSRRAAGLLAAALLVAAGASGCGSADTTAACDKVQAELSSISSQGMAHTTDPKGMKQAYDDGATKLRQIAKGTDIEDETEQVALALEKLGQQVSDFAAHPSTTMPQLDTASLTSAGTALKNACT